MVKIEFLEWTEKTPLEYDVETVKEAVEKAVEDGANLYGATLSRANLYGANLDGTNLYGANLYGANLSRANLDGANLSGATLSRANLDGATLSGATLSRANLDGATLYGANLSRANLYGANLSGATLSRANLDGANLSRANLSRANLDGANLYGKQLWHVRPFLTLGLCGRHDRMTNVFFFEDGSEPVVNCGCFCGNIEEFAAIIHKTHAGTFHEVEYMAMVEHFKAIRQYQTEHQEKNETETSEQSE